MDYLIGLDKIKLVHVKNWLSKIWGFQVSFLRILLVVPKII